MLWDTGSRSLRCVVAALSMSAVAATPSSSHAQPAPQSLLQLEVGDSVGLPLPDAKLEVFTLLQGGIVWEWAAVDPGGLPAGTHLLRFSHPGYRPAVFSVPLRDGGKVSLRVRLDPERDVPRRERELRARPVRAIGLALDGRAKTDIIGSRRILQGADIETVNANTFGAVLQRLRDTELKVLPASGGTFRVRGASGAGNCSVSVMINGDRRRVIGFSTFDQMFTPGDVEVIEIFPRNNSIPLVYRFREVGCGLLVVWFRNP